MGQIGASKQLGRLNEPVVFEVSEGPEPGPVGKVVNEDTSAPPVPGISPLRVLFMASAMMVGGYLVLRKLLD